MFRTLFAKNRAKLGVLMNRALNTLVKVHKYAGNHASNRYHIGLHAVSGSARLASDGHMGIDCSMA